METLKAPVAPEKNEWQKITENFHNVAENAARLVKTEWSKKTDTQKFTSRKFDINCTTPKEKKDWLRVSLRIEQTRDKNEKDSDTSIIMNKTKKDGSVETTRLSSTNRPDGEGKNVNKCVISWPWSKHTDITSFANLEENKEMKEVATRINDTAAEMSKKGGEFERQVVSSHDKTQKKISQEAEEDLMAKREDIDQKSQIA